MEYNYTDRLIFCAEWFQVEAQMTRNFYLYYFLNDNSVELFDHKTKKIFLRRTKVPDLLGTDLYIGAKLNIFGRTFDITDYGDTITKNKLAANRQKTFALIKPDGIAKMGDIIRNILTDTGFQINQCRMVKITPDDSLRFYSNKSGEAILPFLVEHLSSGSIVGMELVGDNVVEKFKKLSGPENPEEAKKYPETLRAMYGSDTIKNAIHCSESFTDSKRELDFFFGHAFSTTETLNRCTLGIIKPHSLKEGKMGHILTAIVECGFTITAMKMVHMERTNCEEFYEVYKGVVPEYTQMVLQLSNGPCVALEIVSVNPDVNTHLTFRNLCGPVDPEIGRQLRPNAIRSRFGTNKVLNAIHCTDLEQDCLLEVEYFFKILE